MNDLARLVPFIFDMKKCRITDKNGNPWFAAMDACAILGIQKSGRTFKDFPKSEKAYVVCAGYSISGTCGVGSTDTTSAKPRARKTQRILIINEAGLMRLILKSRKPEAEKFKERIIKLVADFRKNGINWAVLPRLYNYGGKELTWTEYFNQKCDTYLKRHPDATYEDFMRSFSV